MCRYWADEQSEALNREDTDTSDKQSTAGKSLEDQERLGLPIRVPQNLRTFILPSGFPGTHHLLMHNGTLLHNCAL
jgi:hypothetical protein